MGKNQRMVSNFHTNISWPTIKHTTKPNIPTLHYSSSPDDWFVAKTSFSDLVQKTVFYIFEKEVPCWQVNLWIPGFMC